MLEEQDGVIMEAGGGRTTLPSGHGTASGRHCSPAVAVL